MKLKEEDLWLQGSAPRPVRAIPSESELPDMCPVCGELKENCICFTMGGLG